jgi:predicted acyl esterase
MRIGSGAIALLLVAVVFAGCAQSGEPVDHALGSAGDDVAYVMEGDWSTPRQPALYELLPSIRVDVPVADGIEIALGIFYPEIPGCDWAANNIPEGCHLPVVMDAGPYYTDRISIDKQRPQWVNWLVPQGYAVIQMALRGTGESGGCMEFKTPKDANDISDVVDWVAEQSWSNGNVGVAGRSYDGTSAWAAAASGNPHVKTIVPISGAVDAPQLYYRNGTHELRVLIPHIPIYWASYAAGAGGSDPTYRGTDVAANLCPGVAEPHVEGPMGAFTGDAGSEYWQSRIYKQAILDNYQGSAWVIHGMQDWNVDPSQAVPFTNEMIDAGIPTLAWLGQWGHAYPDHSPEHINVRWDWGDQLVSWFDYYLKGTGDEPRLGIEVEDDTYRWRHEERYPPVAQRVPVPADSASFALPGFQIASGSPASFTYESPASGIIAGLPRVHFSFTPTTATGGAFAAELFNERTGDRIGWGVLDLRHRNGGNTDPETLVPGTIYDATLQFEPTDSPVLQGDKLRLVISKDGVEDINPSLDPSPVGMTPFSGVSWLGPDLDLPIAPEDHFISIPLAAGDFRAEWYASLTGSQ